MKIHWRHENNLVFAFYGEPTECEMLARCHRMDGGWRWEVIERLGRFNPQINNYDPALLRCGFAPKRERAMREAVDWMQRIHEEFAKMGE